MAAPRSVAANTLIVMAGTLGSRLLGFARSMIINSFDQRLTDAFNIASSIPNLLRELLAEGALVNSFIPVYQNLSETEKRRFANHFSGILLGINFILLALGIWFAPSLVQLFVVMNQTSVDIDLAVFMTRLVMPFLMLISLSGIAMGLLNADEHFRESSFAPIAFNLVSITLLFLMPHTATYLALGWTVGGIAQLLVQIPSLKKYGLLPKPSLGWHPKLGRVLTLMAPFMLTTGSRQFLNIFMRKLLSTFPEGTLTGYGNAETIFQTVMGLFVVSPTLALYPRLSSLGTAQNWDEFRALTLQALRLILFIATPMSALLIGLDPFIMSIFNLSGENLGKFTAGTAILSTWALAIVPWGINTFLLRTFYARQVTRLPVLVSACSFIMEVVLYYLLTPHFGLYGFGLASTLMGCITLGILAYLYQSSLGFPWRELISYTVKIVPLALIAGISAFAVTHFLFQPSHPVIGLVALALGGGLGLGLYGGFSLWLKIPEAANSLTSIRRLL